MCLGLSNTKNFIITIFDGDEYFLSEFDCGISISRMQLTLRR